MTMIFKISEFKKLKNQIRYRKMFLGWTEDLGWWIVDGGEQRRKE